VDLEEDRQGPFTSRAEAPPETAWELAKAADRKRHRAKRERSRRWRAGWAREAIRPKNARREPSQGWREGGGVRDGQTWKQQHGRKRDVAGSLTVGGYDARRGWGRMDNGVRRHGKHEVKSWVYTEGPAKGCEAIDPWDLARAVGKCCEEWGAQLRWLGDRPAIMPLPAACGRSHVCPICGRAKSRALARAIRDSIEHDDGDGGLALVTLTQRARKGIPLRVELDRWMGAWHRMTRGRPGRAFRKMVRGWYLGREVTRGEEGKGCKVGIWWHAHGHLLLELRDGIDPEAAKAWIQAQWLAATDAECEGFGWQVVAGEQDWWKPIPRDDLKAVHQAAKYPTPVSDLHPTMLAEFVAVAHGRRWHQGGGRWRGVIKEAKERRLEAGPEWGVSASGAGPRDAPKLDQVGPGFGLTKTAPDGKIEASKGKEPEIGAWVRWRILPNAAGLAAVDWWLARGGKLSTEVKATTYDVDDDAEGFGLVPVSEDLELWLDVPALSAWALLHLGGRPPSEEPGHAHPEGGAGLGPVAVLPSAQDPPDRTGLVEPQNGIDGVF